MTAPTARAIAEIVAEVNAFSACEITTSVVRSAPMEPLSERIREEVRNCRMTQAELSRASRVPESGISRFMDGKELRSTNLDRLCETLGLELKKTGKARKGK